ncbi:endo-1,4-beta-xylanase [candidate division KSB1 bacterium]|nr:endo-1,4-beta-xylanase [candidate division KSB1 bacterium]
MLLNLMAFSTLSFSQLARDHDKFLGNASDPPIPASYDTYWNQLTPGNAGKWGSVETARDFYNWTPLDQAYHYAISRGFAFKHHILVQGSQQPGWIAALDSASQLEEIEEWIRLVGERYPDLTLADVVGEVISNPPVYKKGLGGDGLTGWDWVIKAFQLARQHLPAKTKLLLLEANIINGGPNFDQFIQIVHLLKDKTLIDGIGLVAHNLENIDTSVVRNSLNQLSATGVDIYIHSLDIGSPDDAQQLALFQEKFPVLWEHPGVKGITFWGYIQNQTYQANGYLLRTDGTERPALAWLRGYLTFPGTYRSFQSGNWNEKNSWEFYDGTNWVQPAPASPSDAQESITISNGHTITVTASDSGSGIVVESGGSLLIHPGVTFLVKNGGRIDLNVSGTIANSGILLKEDPAEIYFANGGTYLHSQDGGSLPSAFWRQGSTVQFDNIKSSLPSNIAQDFSNVVWNCSEQNANLNLGWEKVTIFGNITIQNTGTGRIELCTPGANSDVTLNIRGDVIQSGGQFTAAATDNAGTLITVNHGGNINITGGVFSLSLGSQGGTGATTWNLNAGNFFMSGGTVNNLTSTPDGCKFVFAGDTEQMLTLGEGNTFTALPIEVSSGAILNMGSSVLTGTGFFILHPGATLATANPEGLAGTLQNTGVISLSDEATYSFNGSGLQQTSNLLPSTIANLIIDNSDGVKLSKDVKIGQILDIKSGFLILNGSILLYEENAALKYSGSVAQTTSDVELPATGGPNSLIIANPRGVTLHASRQIPGDLGFSDSGKLTIDSDTLTIASTSNASVSQYVSTENNGLLQIPLIGTEEVLFPLGTLRGFTPVWIKNDGVADLIGVRVEQETTAPAQGGRVNLRWDIIEGTDGGGDYTLKFGWMSGHQSSEFRRNPEANSFLFLMPDTTEAGSGDYTYNYSSQPSLLSRGGIDVLGSFSIGMFKPSVDVVQTENKPAKFRLNQNYPNPFNTVTSIKYTISSRQFVTLKIYNILGKELDTLVNDVKPAGEYKINFDASGLSSGVYFYTLHAGSFVQTKKLMVLK